MLMIFYIYKSLSRVKMMVEIHEYSLENVIYLNTFSRTISPALRVGYMVLPKKLVTDFYERLGFYSCTVPTFEQLVISELLRSGDFERHINRVRRKKRKETAVNR